MYIQVYINECCSMATPETLKTYGGFHKWGGTLKWMVYKGKSKKQMMLCGYPYFRKPPYVESPMYLKWLSFAYSRLEQPCIKQANLRFNHQSWVYHSSIMAM